MTGNKNPPHPVTAGILEGVTSTPIRPEVVGFGKRLRAARERLGFKAAELANRLDLKRSAIAQYESGRTFPSVAVLKKLTRALGVTMDWLVFDECEEVEQIQDKELAAYISRADRLSHRDRSTVKDFIDGLLARMELEEQRARKRRQRVA